jgi:4Fe-4S ferredoxin
MKVTINGEHILSVLEKESFPQLVRDVQANAGKFPVENKTCEEACPLNLIHVTRLTPNGNVVEDFKALPKKERKKLQAQIDVEKERCPCCRVCEFKCPEDVMHARKFIHGKILIHQEKCPDGCTDCLDVCPITGALYYSDEDKKVHADELFCVYCGACKAVCPVEEALEVKRTKIVHTPVRSGAWNKALEKLTSPVEMTKELKAKGSLKAVASVGKRFPWACE